MKFNSNIILFVLVSFFCELASSQQVGNQDQIWEVRVSAIPTYSRILDKSFSSIPYNGINFGIGSSAKYIGRKASHELNGLYSWGTLKASGQPDYSLNKNFLN